MPFLSLAEESGGSSVLEGIRDRLLAAISVPRSVEFECRTEVVDTAIFREMSNLPPKENAGRTVDVYFRSNGARYWYSKSSLEYGETIPIASEKAFDGENYLARYRANSFLEKSKSDPLGRHLRLGFANPLNQFAFLLPQLRKDEPTVS